jgi:hypothetical protein
MHLHLHTATFGTRLWFWVFTPGLKWKSDLVIELVVPPHHLFFRPIRVHDGLIVDTVLAHKIFLRPLHCLQDTAIRSSWTFSENRPGSVLASPEEELYWLLICRVNRCQSLTRFWLQIWLHLLFSGALNPLNRFRAFPSVPRKSLISRGSLASHGGSHSSNPIAPTKSIV